ncbi:polysaccharide deacetylase family protein [Flavobacterium sp. RHBU_3]|uniref:polysaccharide deacetylase family protein n=1 Tax=Flavobacterium sp. RHBU_3 TaxID=3391184 RepID=UPI0039846BD9
MKLVKILCLYALMVAGVCEGQTAARNWNGKRCAVVLTYDDALNVHLDKVIPQLNSFGFKGTFYLIGNAPVVSNRIDDWRKAAQQGHELGNHTLNHPCIGSLPGRGFITPETDLARYTVARAVSEIRATNTILKAIDGKSLRTFAYPCGDLTINDTLFYDRVKAEFACGRGVAQGYLQAKEVNLSDVNAFAEINATAEQMIAEVEKAEKAGSFIVFIFHGVGGEHPLNVDLEEHRKLLEYLKKKEKDIWVTTMVDLAVYIQKMQVTKR